MISRCVVVFAGLVSVAWPALAAAAPSLQLDLGAEAPAQADAAVKMVLVLTVLAVAPALLLATTSFLRIAIVLAFVRSGLGIQGMPPNQVMMALALFLTFAVMGPVASEVYGRGLGPYLRGELAAEAAFASGSAPLRDFMLRQTRAEDLELFYELHRAPRPASPGELRLSLLVPAFITSELRTAFEMGFLLLVPFLLVDLVVASILVSMGMVMVPPTLVSLPVKVMLFVVADGWHLLVGSLARSFA